MTFYHKFFEPNRNHITKIIRQIVASHFNAHNHDNYNQGQQEDCYLFFTDLMNMLPISVQNLFLFDIIIDIQCRLCKTPATYVDTKLTSFEIQLDHSNKLTDLTKSISLKDVSERQCSRCKQLTTHDDQRRIIIPIENRYIVAYVHNFTNFGDNYLKINSRLTNVSHEYYNIPNIDSVNFKIRSIIIRNGETIQNGHFKIWTRNLQTDKWLYISDKEIKSFNKIHNSLNNVNIIIFEREVI